MLGLSNFRNEAGAVNQHCTMRAETISKNGRNPKSLTSRGNFVRKSILILIGMVFFSWTFAQDFKGNPKANERVIETFGDRFPDHGMAYSSYPDDNLIYRLLLAVAKEKYPNKVIDIRNVTYSVHQSTFPSGYYVSISAKIVEVISPETKLNETLVKAVNKAMNNVRAGSRLAIDQVSASGGLDRVTINDQLIDVLLDNGYKVVAKEYLEKLKEEQEQQQKGGYNERTTAQTDNFSGVGYFLNVRVNEKSIRVQVINVSTGEYVSCPEYG